MSWQLVSFAILATVVLGGFLWFERSRPPARLVALVAALAALAIAGRLVFAPVPNLVATTDIALLTGYALGGPPGFAVGALAAPISNIWLGQGPWTAWQMGAWGLAGLLGAAAAALSGRRLNRVGLATLCGFAGLAYGAILDLSVMVTYGGEQSLDRYLALSVRGIPFNLLHAAGNFAIAFAAGPALVRMISRYRTRLEFSWRPATATSLSAGLLALALLSGLASAPPAEAGKPSTTHWLIRSQNADGGFAAARDQPSNPAMTGWAMLGLEAAGRNPRDVKRGGDSAVDYLRNHVDRLKAVGDLERTILALEAAGLDPHSFAGRNLVNELRKKRDRDGSVDGQVNLTAFFALAMRAAGTDTAQLRRSAKWLRRAQNANGGWGIQPQAPSEADSTGAALQAIVAAGQVGKATERGVHFLRRTQASGGGFRLATTGIVNSQSTSWAIQGLVAAQATGKPLARAQAYMARMRVADAHYRYSSSSDQTPVWVTVQALLAVRERAFPLAAVSRDPDPGGSATQSGSGTGVSTGGSTSSGQIPTPPISTPAPSVGAPTTPPIFPPSDGGNGTTPPGEPTKPGEADAALDDLVPGAAGGGGAEGEGDAGTTTPDSPDGDAATATAEAAAAAAAAQGDEYGSGDSAPALAMADAAAPYVIGGLLLLAGVLASGFVWYRERLP